LIVSNIYRVFSEEKKALIVSHPTTASMSADDMPLRKGAAVNAGVIPVDF